MAIRVSSGLLFPRGRGLLLPLRLTSLTAISAIWRANASRSAWNSSGTPSFQAHGLTVTHDRDAEDEEDAYSGETYTWFEDAAIEEAITGAIEEVYYGTQDTV